MYEIKFTDLPELFGNPEHRSECTCDNLSFSSLSGYVYMANIINNCITKYNSPTCPRIYFKTDEEYDDFIRTGYKFTHNLPGIDDHNTIFDLIPEEAVMFFYMKSSKRNHIGYSKPGCGIKSPETIENNLVYIKKYGSQLYNYDDYDQIYLVVSNCCAMYILINTSELNKRSVNPEEFAKSLKICSNILDLALLRLK